MVSIYIYSAIRGPHKSHGKIGIAFEVDGQEKQPIISQRYGVNRSQAEMLAFYLGLQASEAAGGEGDIELYTDSDYIFGSVTRFLPKWQENGWHNSKGEPVKNGDAWKKIAEHMKNRKCTVHLKEQHPYTTWLIDNTKGD